MTLGEAAQSLGTYTAASERLAENIWPVTFTVDGATAVTLSLALPAADGAVLVDDLDLVGDTPGDVELLTDTACETGTAWKKLDPWPAALGNGAVQDAAVRYYDGFLSNGAPFGQYWGYNRFNGSKFLFLVENGGMQQTVNIPKAGIYRLVYHERSRKGTHNGANPVMAWIRNAAGTYTNMIARSTAHCSTNFVEYTCHFRLPAAGEYVLAFQGTGYNWATKPNEDIESLVDGVSLTYETGTLNETPDVPERMSIDVAPHAILALDFPGTLKVRRLHLGGLPVSGHVDATTHPAYLTGMGALDAPPAGSVFLLR